MFSLDQIKGLSLPDKTICLTFDDGPGDVPGDGPGPKTRKIAKYLHDHHIRATFFMVGKFIEQFPEIPGYVFKLGHSVGNHSYSHPDMQSLFKSRKDVLGEIKRTNELIKKATPAHKIAFRAPYGSWSPAMSEKLNGQLEKECENIGLYYWDIEVKDWTFWKNDKTPVECAAAYFKAINKTKKGILLMHDSTADIELARKKNLAFETIQIIVPELKRQGYRFMPLDAIPMDRPLALLR